MIKLPKLEWTNIGAAIVLYAAILIYQGYQYGQGDQSQILPCLYAQDHPGVYAQDHYVTNYLESSVNERSVFHPLFRFLGYDQPWVVWGWHIVLSVTLILAWIKIAGLGLKNKGYQFLAVGVIFIAGFHTAMGSNELYYNSVVPSLAAKALGSWAIYFWFREKYTAWWTLLAIAGFLQPLVGIQLFLLTSVSLILHLLIRGGIKSLPWKQMTLYLLVTFPWLYILARNNGGITNPEAFMDTIEFRLAHHFFASYFGGLHLAAGIFFAMMALLFYRLRLRWFMLAIVAGCIVYEIGVEYYRVPAILYTQWWKTTIWLEAFAIIAFLAWLEKQMPFFHIHKYKPVIPLLIFLMVSLYRLTGWYGEKPVYMFPWSDVKSEEVEISIQAGTLTPEDAVFVVPIRFTAFRWYSKRSTYVDYKAMLHQETFLYDWYKRIQQIYAYGMAEKKGGFSIDVFSTTLLEDPSVFSIELWKSLGITHIISPSPTLPSLRLVGKNNAYAIYSLD